MTTFETLITVLLMIPCFTCAYIAGQIASDLRTLTQPPEMRHRFYRSLLRFIFLTCLYGTTAALYVARILHP